MKSVYFPLNKGDALSQMYRPTEGNVQRTLSNLKASFTILLSDITVCKWLNTSFARKMNKEQQFKLVL